MRIINLLVLLVPSIAISTANAAECKEDVYSPKVKKAINYALEKTLNRRAVAYKYDLSLESYEAPKLCSVGSMTTDSKFMKTTVAVKVIETDGMGASEKREDICQVILSQLDGYWILAHVICDELEVDENVETDKLFD